MVYSGDVAAVLGNDFRNLEQLSGFVDELNGEHACATTLQQTALDYSVEDVYVDVTARYYADYVLAFDGHFVEHGCCNRYGACALGNELEKRRDTTQRNSCLKERRVKR